MKDIDQLIVHILNLILQAGIFAINSTISFFFDILGSVKTIAFVLTIALAGVISYVLVDCWEEAHKTRHLRLDDFVGMGPKKQKQPIKAWRFIEDRLKTHDAGQMKLAVIEADNLFNELLLVLGYRGDTFEDRLLWLNPERHTFLDDVRVAHAFSKKLSSEVGGVITFDEARDVLLTYRRAFEELGILDRVV